VRVPRFRYFRFYFAVVSACLLSIALTASFAHAQGFTGGITSGESSLQRFVLETASPGHNVHLGATDQELKNPCEIEAPE
jgi:hypothetical protein